MMIDLLKTIKSKKLGVLIKDARVNRDMDVPECARAMKVEEDVYQAYEMGELSPSLPELELLALYLDLPVEHFQGDETVDSDEHPFPVVLDKGNFIELRDRIIGLSLKKKRVDLELSAEDLAEKTGIPVESILQFEDGGVPVGLPDLEIISNEIDLPLADLKSTDGPIAKWVSSKQQFQDYLSIPEEIRGFILEESHHPYINLAMKLSEMSADELRTIAESILEITL